MQKNGGSNYLVGTFNKLKYSQRTWYIKQEVHWFIINLHRCLYIPTYEIKLTTSQWASQLPKFNCIFKTFFSVIFLKNYVPKWGEGPLGTMERYKGWMGNQ